MNDEAKELQARGWYKTSTESEVERFWNGKKWTNKVRISSDSSTSISPVKFEPDSRSQFRTWITKDRIAFGLTCIAVVLVGIFIWQSTIPSPVNDQSMNHRTFPTETESTPISKNKKPRFLETTSPSSTDTCKLADQRVTKLQPNNVGFPITPDIIPIQGTAHMVIMAVDFPDAPGTQSETGYLNDQLNKIQAWANYFSNGKLNFDFQTYDGWVHAPFPSADYFVPATTPNSDNPYNDIMTQMGQDIVNASGNTFDFTNVDGMLFLFPPTIQGVDRDLGQRGVIIQTPQGPKNLFFWGGGKYHYIDSNGYLTAATKRADLWSYWIHEMLHSQGLPLHAPGNGIQTSLANNQYGDSFALDRWESFLAGWIDDNQVFCTDLTTLTTANVKLSPVEAKTSGNQMAIVKLNDSEALVIESRRATGYSSQWPKDLNGIFVYRINTTLDNDRSQECCGDTGNDPAYSKWGYFLMPEGHKPDTSRGPLNQHLSFMAKENDKVIYGGVEIELVYSGDQDYVKITKQ